MDLIKLFVFINAKMDYSHKKNSHQILFSYFDVLLNARTTHETMLIIFSQNSVYYIDF